MAIHWHADKLRPGWQTLGLAVDIIMIVLVIANLALIIFDWLFASATIQSVLQSHTPGFFTFYKDTIHSDFIRYDLMFVAVYLTEFVIRWGFAIVRQTYHRWFFFPFVHWYDLLGCIPVGSFRWLRVLRIVSLVMRLQRMGVIDLSDTWIGQTVLKYYRILIEELSDRIVTNVLEGMQRQIRQGNPLIHRIEDDVLAPRRTQLVDFLAERIARGAEATHQQYRDELGRYLSYLTDEAISETPSGRRLAALPVAGPRAIALLGDTVREIGTALVDQMVEDISNPTYRSRLDEVLDSLITQAAGDRGRLNDLVRDTTLDILEQVKIEVNVKQWKLAEQQPSGD
jgi:hypothetical protein